MAQLGHELIARFEQESGRVKLTSPLLVFSTTADETADDRSEPNARGEAVQHELAETRAGMLRVVLGVLDDISS